MKLFIKTIDGISEASGLICAWTLFAIGFFITFEVAARYLFNAPTIWVDEVCRILQVWVVFLAASYALKHGEVVTIEVFLSQPDTALRRIAETLAVVMMFIFAGAALYFGFELWLKSTLAGHTTDTFLAPPMWFTHAPVWIGSALLILQGLVRLIRVWTGTMPAPDSAGPLH